MLDLLILCVQMRDEGRDSSLSFGTFIFTAKGGDRLIQVRDFRLPLFCDARSRRGGISLGRFRGARTAGWRTGGGGFRVIDLAACFGGGGLGGSLILKLTFEAGDSGDDLGVFFLEPLRLGLFFGESSLESKVFGSRL